MWVGLNAGAATLGSGAFSPRNLLLRSLPLRELEQLAPFLSQVALTRKRVIQHAGFPIEHVYFVEEGLVSVLASAGERSAVEIMLIGREGAVGSAAVLGARTSPLRYFVQIGGCALRIGVDDLGRVMSAAPELKKVLYGY